MIEIELSATAAAPSLHVVSADRPPMSLALVIDRSGSMRGPKLGFVKEAVLHLLGVLADTDQVSIVSFDQEVNVLLAPGRLTPERRAHARHEVATLERGGSTALFDGWRTGAALVADNPVANAVTRVFLLTDGLANRGESRPEVLEIHAQEFFVRGVATSTFGVGAEFDQFLLEGMAARGGGSYRFIEAPEQIPAMFAEEMGDLLSTGARNVEVKVTIPSGASLSLLGNLPHTLEGDTLLVPIGALYAGQPRTLFIEALLPPRASDKAHEEALAVPVRVSGTAGTNGDSRFQVSASVVFGWAEVSEVQAAPVSDAVRQAAALVRVATAEAEALRLEYGGRGAEGAQLLEEAVAACAPYLEAGSSEELARFARRLRQRERLDPVYSKGRHAAAYKRRHKN